MYDIEQLIEEVASRPAIWDCNSVEYQIRKERIAAWEEICYTLLEDYERHDVEKKSELCRAIQRKWKSLRDCYVRDLNNSRHKNGRLYRRKYIFFKALSFLKSTVKCKIESKPNEGKVPLNDDTMDLNLSEDFQQEALQEETVKPLHKRQASNSRNRWISKKKLPTAQIELTQDHQPLVKVEENDDDRLFLLSLLKDLKKIPEDNKLEAKSELLLVLNKWKRSTLETWHIERLLKDE